MKSYKRAKCECVGDEGKSVQDSTWNENAGRFDWVCRCCGRHTPVRLRRMSKQEALRDVEKVKRYKRTKALMDKLLEQHDLDEEITKYKKYRNDINK